MRGHAERSEYGRPCRRRRRTDRSTLHGGDTLRALGACLNGGNTAMRQGVMNRDVFTGEGQNNIMLVVRQGTTVNNETAIIYYSRAP